MKWQRMGIEFVIDSKALYNIEKDMIIRVGI